MKNLTVAVLLLTFLAPALGFAQADREYIPFNSLGYQYQFVKATDGKVKTFSDPAQTDGTIGGWATTPAGQGAWGTLNKPGTDPCPLNVSSNIKITWPSGRDVLIRRWIDATDLAGASDVRITVAIDNAVIVYWNNKPVYLNGSPTGQFTHDVCAAETFPGSKKPDGDVTFTIPNDYLLSTVSTNGKPQYLLAVRGVTLAEKSYIDIKTVANFGYKLTVLPPIGSGEVKVEPVKAFYSPTDNITLTAKAQTGYFLGRIQEGSTIATGLAGVPFASGADQFANPVTFQIKQNTTVQPYFTSLSDLHPLPIPVSDSRDYDPKNGVVIENTLRWAIKQAENYPGLNQIQVAVNTPITLVAPLSATDLLSIEKTGTGYVTIQPADPNTFSATAGLDMPGVFVKWGYSSGGITLSGLQIQNFLAGPGLSIESEGNTVERCFFTNNREGICIHGDNNVVAGCTFTLNIGDGICIEDGNNNTLQGNEIYENGGRGVFIKEASISDAIPPPSGNTIQGNSIYSNVGLGIDLADRLGGFGATMNRYLPIKDPVTGITYNWDDFINKAQHYPDLEEADPLTSKVKCQLYAPEGKSFSIEIFREPMNPDKAKQKLLGSIQSSRPPLAEGTSGNGVYTFELITTQPFELGDVISATATDENGNTSEFSPFIYAGVKTRVYGPVEQPDDPSDNIVTNRWVVNTTFRGDPLHWPNGVATLSIEEGFPEKYADTASVALGSSGPWSYPGSPLTILKAASPGPADGWSRIPDGVNNVVYTEDFVDERFAGPGFENTLAISRVRYNSFTGEIFDADILVNGSLVNLVKKDSIYVFDAIFGHELGHAIGGLGDIYDRNDQPYNLFMGTNPARGLVTMYGIVRKNEDYQTTVHQDDKEGLNYIFGNVLPSNVDLALLIDASQSFADPAGYNGFTGSVAAAKEQVDRLREGDGIAVVSFQGTSASVLVPFERIGALPNQVQKDRIKGDIDLLHSAVGDDRRAIGNALKVAASELGKAPRAGRRAGILFSAGNETESPSALDYNEVLQNLTGANPVRVFTMGFGSPEGNNLGSKLADATGGLFYETNDATISPNANHAWEVLTGQQLLLDYLNYSGEGQAISYKGSPTWQAISWKGATSQAISWKGATDQAISWKGATNTALVDDGTTGLYPAISWKGSSTVAKISGTGAPTTGAPKFFLGLITPDFKAPLYPEIHDDPSLYPWAEITENTVLPTGLLSPDNGMVGSPKKIQGVEYVEDESYAFYRITADYTGTRNGIWILVPLGANGENASEPNPPVAVNARLATLTDVAMEVKFDSSNYLPSEPVRITVSLFEGGLVQASHTVGGGPITGKVDSLNVAVILPSGNTLKTAVDFAEVGNGVYTGTFHQTETKGVYSFVVTAEGTAPNSGAYFFRKFDQSIYVAPAYASASLFAQNHVTMLDGSKIITGDILVNQPVPSQSTGVSLLVGLGASTPGGYVIKADKIQVLAGATVASTIYTTAAPLNAGTITGTFNTGFSPPYGVFPPFESTTGDLQGDISVATSTTRTITPSTTDGPSFGNVTLQPGATLTLEPGVYEFRSLRMKSGSSVWCKGATKILIGTGIHADNGSYIGTKPDLSVSPSSIIVYVAGTNAQGPGSYSVDISPKSKVLASLYAPNGTIYLNQETQAAGAFFAKDIVLGQLTTVRLSSGFAVLAKSAASTRNAGPADNASVPTTYELSQNYPNPFNPTTQIKYGLPQASPVNLTIYNMLGQEVVRLVDEVQPEGYHVVEWNGRNRLGTIVGSGMYIFQLRAGDFVQTKKMMLLK